MAPYVFQDVEEGRTNVIKKMSAWMIAGHRIDKALTKRVGFNLVLSSNMNT